MNSFKPGDKVYIRSGDYSSHTGVVKSEESSVGCYSVLINTLDIEYPVAIYRTNLMPIDIYLKIVKRNLDSTGYKVNIEKPLEYWEDKDFKLEIPSGSDKVEFSANYDTLKKSKGFDEPIYVEVNEKGLEPSCTGISVEQAKQIINYLQKCVDYLESEN